MLANWVKQAVSAGGAGNLTLGSAEAGHISLNTAFGVGPRFWYDIRDGNDREVGVGYLSASTTLVRESVRETLVSGTLDRTSPSAISVTTSAIVSVNASQQSVLGGHIGEPWNNTGIDGFCSLNSVSEAQAGSTQTKDLLMMYPFWWVTSRDVSQASLRVTTLGASGVMRLGIYAVAPNGNPGVRLKEFTDAAVIDTSTTGNKTATPSASFWLPSGFYYMAVCAGVANCNIAGPQYSPGGMWLGVQSGGSSTYCIYRAYSYAALPADETSQSYTPATYFASFWLK